MFLYGTLYKIVMCLYEKLDCVTMFLYHSGTSSLMCRCWSDTYIMVNFRVTVENLLFTGFFVLSLLSITPIASPIPRFTVVVVLPTPPFWLHIAIVLQFGISASSFQKNSQSIVIWTMYLTGAFPNRSWQYLFSTPLAKQIAYGKSLRNRLLICIIGISPLPGTPPAP